MKRRKRGVILSENGWRKLQKKFDQFVQSGYLRDKAQKSVEIFGESRAEPGQKLGSSTIGQILNREKVDPNSLEKFFAWFDLTLEPTDYIQPVPESQVTEKSPSSIPNYIPLSGAANFVGRDVLLTQLHETLERHRLVALAGMGGVGKTEVSIQYANRYLRVYPAGVCWIFARPLDAPNSSTIADQIIAFATVKLGIKIPDTIHDVDRLQYCWQHWPQGRALLIYDDIEQYSDIAPHYLPTDERFKILITTRLQLGSPVYRFPVEVLHRDDALALLTSFFDEERAQDNTDANELCDFLGDLPLGIELAGHYLASDPNLSVTALLDELRKRQRQRQVTQHQALAGDYQSDPAWTLTARRGVEAAFDLTWEKLNLPTQLLAKMLGRFEPGPIRWRTVDTMSQVLAEEYPDEVQYDSESIQRARSYLMKYSLLKPFNDNPYRLHPLIREFFRGKTTDEEEAQYGSV